MTRIEIFVPELVLTRGEVAAYERYVDWRAERAGQLVDRHVIAHKQWLERQASLAAAKREVARKREEEARARQAAAEQRRRACEAEKALRAERLRRRMRELGFHHPAAPREDRRSRSGRR